MTREEILVGTIVKGWKVTMARMEKALSSLTDAEFDLEVAAERNRVRYIVGHLAAFHDQLIELIGLGRRRYPELDVFIAKPDRTFEDGYSRLQLVQIFAELTDFIGTAIETMSPGDWLRAHGAVSEEDFAKDPFRNRLSVLSSRTAHVALHLGQIRLVVKR